MSSAPTPRINLRRLLERLDELAQIGAIEGTDGCARLAFGDDDRAARDLVVTWMRDLDLDVSIDGIGNVIATMGAPGGAPVMMGSHIDTVRTGGRYDGNLGVLAGLEVIETVRAFEVDLLRPLAVGFFSDEEGARFPPDMLGSLVYVGGMAIEDAHGIVGIDGATVGDELERIGYLGPAPCPATAPHAFVELHIEQGPVLEAEGFGIGAVTGVQGISWTELTIVGQSNHAGTTPMSMRRDPGLVAARIAAGVRDLVTEIGPPQVGTVGRLRLEPDLVNVVPARATMTVDLRHTEGAVLAEAREAMLQLAERAAADEGCTLTSESLADFDPVEFDPRVVTAVEEVATRQGLAVRTMASGAGHDAQMLARVCPSGMVFVPSRDGLSHNPAEHTDPADLEAGANVLLDVVLTLSAKELT